VTVTTADEALRDATTDSVTFAFGDASAELFGIARFGLSGAPTGPRQGSVLALLFAGRTPVAALARGELAVAGDAGWSRLALAGLQETIEAPLARWTVSFGSEDGYGFALEFSAVGDPVALPADAPVGRLGGMAGYEQPCRVRGVVKAGGRERTIDALGQRGHAWGDPDWKRIELARTVSAWTSAGCASLTAVRPAGARDHSEEATWTALWEPEAEPGTSPQASETKPGTSPEASKTKPGTSRRARQVVLDVEAGRLSTTYDADGHARRAGLELWPAGDTGEESARRASGEVLCGSSLELGSLRLDCAFFRWHLDGTPGVGRYDILRRVA
jgi:hypothetical protein